MAEAGSKPGPSLARALSTFALFSLCCPNLPFTSVWIPLFSLLISLMFVYDRFSGASSYPTVLHVVGSSLQKNDRGVWVFFHFLRTWFWLLGKEGCWGG